MGCSDYIFNEQFNKEDIIDDISKYYTFDQDKAIEKILFTKKDIPEWGNFSLKTSEVSLMLKNILSFDNFLKSNDEYILLLEDDVEFKEGIKYNDILDIVKNCPDGWDALFIGGYSYELQHTTVKEHYGDYSLVNHPATNGVSSVVYNKKSVSKIINSLKSFHLPVDWEMNYIFKRYEMNVYHYKYICKQTSGSKFQSSLI